MAVPRTGTPGTRHLQVPSSQPASLPSSLLALKATQNHPEGLSPSSAGRGPKGEQHLCFVPRSPKREVASPSLCPASPLFAWGSSTHDTHGPKAPLRGQSPVPDTDKPLWHHPDAAIPPWSPSFRSEQRAPGTAPAQPQPGHQGVGKNTAEGLKEEQRGRKPV